jgi:uncharacterized protein (DUF1786 family)
MKVLAIDIGAGTQDILLFDSERKIENCISLVLPTPSRIFAQKLKTITGNVYIYGDTIGGGSLNRAIINHIKKGYRVIMDEKAAYSIRNDLDEVRSMGIEIGKKPPSDSFSELEICEIDLKLLKDFLINFGEDISEVDAIAIAVQDHGVSPKGVSDRVFRFENIKAMLIKDNRPESFHFLDNEVPNYLLRMKSAVDAVRRYSQKPLFLMDTAFSAILGCMDEVKGASLVVNMGNGHTISALLIGGKIEGIYEHHTHVLNPKKLESDLRLFIKGELSSKKVLEEDGHGVITLTPFSGKPSVIVTGPNRDIFQSTSFEFKYASPGGNMMMTGPIGLVKAVQYRFRKQS